MGLPDIVSCLLGVGSQQDNAHTPRLNRERDL